MNINYDSFISIAILYIFGYIEAFMIPYVGSRVLGKNIPIKELLIIALVQDIAIRNFRLIYHVVPLPFGVHIIFGLLMMAFLVKWRARSLGVSMAAAISAVGYAFVLLGTVLVWLILMIQPALLQSTLTGYLTEQLPLILATVIIALNDWQKQRRGPGLAKETQQKGIY